MKKCKDLFSVTKLAFSFFLAPWFDGQLLMKKIIKIDHFGRFYRYFIAVFCRFGFAAGNRQMPINLCRRQLPVPVPYLIETFHHIMLKMDKKIMHFWPIYNTAILGFSFKKCSKVSLINCEWLVKNI